MLLLLKTVFGRGGGIETTSHLKAEGASKRAKKLLESRSSAVLGAEVFISCRNKCVLSVRNIMLLK